VLQGRRASPHLHAMRLVQSSYTTAVRAGATAEGRS